jgi:2-iminobutanoate/2-iminopropanoate deaminase
MNKRPVLTSGAPAPFGGAPYSQGVVHGDLVFVAGQVGVDPATGDYASGDIQGQTAQALANVAAVLEAADSGLHALLQVLIFLARLDDREAMNRVYASVVPEPRPVRAAVEVARLRPGALVEIVATAHTGGMASRMEQS